MGRHSIGYEPEPAASVDPPGGPIDPGVPGDPMAPAAPGTPDAPSVPSVPGGPAAPQEPLYPEPGPNSPEITPSEPPPYAPDESGDGSVPAPSWHSAGQQVL